VLFTHVAWPFDCPGQTWLHVWQLFGSEVVLVHVPLHRFGVGLLQLDTHVYPFVPASGVDWQKVFAAHELLHEPQWVVVLIATLQPSSRLPLQLAKPGLHV
jgi:hypothetical protein